ncbi:MAG: hypothetical protein M0Z53_14835 [Thermaerobacter sp.]|nr:hypothetical protein [Thermaerobacter sp.]
MMTSWPLLPLSQKSLTRAEAADLFRGLAEFIEQYPADAVVVTVNIEAAAPGPPQTKTKRRKSPSGA